MTIKEAGAEGWKESREMKLWKPRQGTLWALEWSLDLTLIATEACRNFNPECDMIWFPSLRLLGLLYG